MLRGAAVRSVNLRLAAVALRWVNDNGRLAEHDVGPMIAALLSDQNRWVNARRGIQSASEGSAEAVRLALLADDGPGGTFSDNKGIVPW